MPQWLVDFWTVYGEMITPVLVTFALSIITYIALKIKTDAKVNAQKADLQIQALKDVSNREDLKPQVMGLTQEVDALKTSVALLGEMISVAFQNSTLDSETKAALSTISNKIKYGSEDNLVEQLEADNLMLQEQLKAVSAQLETLSVSEVVVPETRKRTRR